MDWQAVWVRRGPRAVLLWPLSLLYRALLALRSAAYRAGLLRSERLPVPVIVIGNVVAGGAGKTPLAIAVVRHLQARGIACGVISRGYGRRTTDCRPVRSESTAHQVGDEPLLIHRGTGAPVFVARRRADAGRALLAAHPATRVLVCDDGLQHRALQADVALCVFDARGTGNGWLLPAGPLREPWPRTVDAVLLSAPVASVSLPGRAPQFAAPRRLAGHAVDGSGRPVPLASLRGQRLHAVAGIAQPERFFAALREHGLVLEHTEALPDHYDFDSWPGNLEAGCSLICTEKDAVKLWPRNPGALAVPLVCEPEPAFWDWLQQRLAQH